MSAAFIDMCFAVATKKEAAVYYNAHSFYCCTFKHFIVEVFKHYLLE